MLGLHRKTQTNKVPLLMERASTHSDNEHVIDIASTSNSYASISSTASTSNTYESISSQERPAAGNLEQQRIEDQLSTSSRPVPVHQPPRLNSMNSSSLVRRGSSRGSRQRSPLNSILWISVELVLTLAQILATILVLSLSRNEKPRAPLKTWLVGYASGCVAILPLLYWRYRYRNVGFEQDVDQLHRESPQGANGVGPGSRRVAEAEDTQTTRAATGDAQNGRFPNSRLKLFVQYFKMSLDCFFAIWFVVGNVWIFGGQSSAAEAPSVYRLCIVFLAFCCIGYAMPFILCTTICCCLPCIIALLGVPEDFPQTRGATEESINSLPTYKFKAKKNKSSGGSDDEENTGGGGIVAAGTERERLISGEDAVCCICLSAYANDDDLRELPCEHFFHNECVDKWLKINATCPLCKAEADKTDTNAGNEMNPSRQNSDNP